MGGLTTSQRNIIISITVFLLLVLLAFLAERSLSLWARATATEFAASVNLTFAADDLSIHVFRLTPWVDIQGLEVAAVGKEPLLEHADVSIHLGWWDLVTGLSTVQAVQVNALSVNLLVDDHGVDNVKDVVMSLLSLRSADGPAILVERVEVAQGQLEYINDQLLHSGLFRLGGKWRIDGAVIESEVNLSGDVNSLPVAFTAVVDADLSGNWGGTIAIEGELAELSLLVNADAGDLNTAFDAQFDLDLRGRDLKTVLSRLSLGHTDISDVAFKISSRYKPDDTGTSDIHLALDSSTAEGKFGAEGLRDPGQTKRIVATVNAQSIFADAILGSSSVGQRTTPTELENPTDVFSNTPITGLDALDNVDIDLDVLVKTLYHGDLRVNDLKLSLDKSGDEMQLGIDSEDFGGGIIEGNLSLKTDEQGIQGKLYAQGKRVPISVLMSLGDLPDGVASGKLSGESKFWVSGRSMANLASSLDGGFFMLIEEGKLDSLLVEMAGIDFMESVSLVMKRDLQQTDIRCGYMDLQAVGGLVTVKDFIVDTEDSVFLASGQVDLGRETVDLKFSPLPRDASFFAATTPVNIVGSLASPKIRPGGKLYTRVALAAAMVALAGPATIVLPFIEMGNGGEKSYCSELFGH